MLYKTFGTPPSPSEAALRGEPRMQTLPVASALSSHRTGPPPISPSKRKFSLEPGDDDRDCENDHVSKMTRIFSPHLNKSTANGDCRKDFRERSRSPIERAVAPAVSLHGGHLYTSLPSLSMEQPLALTKSSVDASRPAGLSPTLTPVERQQNRPSVITCASAGARNCNLSHCPIAHSGCAAPGPASYRRPPSAAASWRPGTTTFSSPCSLLPTQLTRRGTVGGGLTPPEEIQRHSGQRKSEDGDRKRKARSLHAGCLLRAMSEDPGTSLAQPRRPHTARPGHLEDGTGVPWRPLLFASGFWGAAWLTLPRTIWFGGWR
uniref:Vestigial like family member 4 n=1 Tax=Oryctolagus cuniculus TaxID=9986 RepID=A0A5F9CUU6_RABIT